MTADQRAVARILEAVDVAMECNNLHDHLGTWRALSDIKLNAELLSRAPAPGTTDALDLAELTHGAEQ